MVFYTFGFTVFLKKGQKKKRKWYLSNWKKKKNRGKTKQCYHDDICRWKRGSFSSKVEITRGIVWIKILKI